METVLKIVMLSVLSLSMTPNTAYSYDLQDLQKDTATVALTTGALVATYGIAYSSCTILTWSAQQRYHNEITLLQLHAPYDAIKAELKITILAYHDAHCASGCYRNYPFVKYVHDLDWYINRLYWLHHFQIGTDRYTTSNKLISNLETLRAALVTDYEYILERRDFEKQQRKQIRSAY